MSNAASQASKFYEQAVNDGKVFTVLDADSFLVFPMAEGDTVPFWSSATRIERVQAAHPKYRAYTIDEIPLGEFLSKVIPLLSEEGIRIGVNWSGKNLTGYDLSPSDLLKNLEYWIEKREAPV